MCRTVVSRYLCSRLSSNWIVAGGNTSGAGGGITGGGTTGVAAVVGTVFRLAGGGIATVGTPTR